MKTLIGLVLTSGLLLTGCNQPKEDADFQQRMKTWSAQQEQRQTELISAIAELKRATPQPKFTITTLNGEHYKRIFKIEETSGESWLYLDGETNHEPGWLKLGYLQIIPTQPKQAGRE